MTRKKRVCNINFIMGTIMAETLLIFFSLFSTVLFIPVAALREKKNKRRSAAKQVASGNTMTTTPPVDYQIKTNPTRNMATRVRPHNPHHFNQISYPNYNPHYANYFGSFHGLQAMQPQLAPRAGVGPFNFPQGNQFGHSYIGPMQTVGGIRFGQMNMQGNEACNGFTAYNNPYGVVWRQN